LPFGCHPKEPNVPKDDERPSRDEPTPVNASGGLEERRRVVAEYIRSLAEFLKAVRNKLN
jgi:hypothetical protein